MKSLRMRCRPGTALLAVLLLPRLISGAGAATRSADPHARAPAGAMTAMIIVARGVVSDPNFAGSIVVVMNNLGPAPVGIIVNRPMPLTVSRLFPKLERLAHVSARVYYGGPVAFGRVWYLFRARTAPAGAVRVCDGVYVSARRKLLLHLLARRKPMRGLRIFVGHAGWAPGQLQTEIEQGAWRPRRADAKAIFDPRPLRPWPAAGRPRPGA